jgi:hypothetical protein
VAHSAVARCRVEFRAAFHYDPANPFEIGGPNLARKTVLVCATLRLTFTDARRGAKQADLCDTCAGDLPGRATARRGRRPKSAAA